VRTGLTDVDLKTQLLSVASALHPGGTPFVSVVELAKKLGTTVSLRLQGSRSANTAQIDLWTTPARIVLHRFSKVEGEREIVANEETLLTSRERFSIAHELGHWVLFTRFQIGPQSHSRLYWEQEEAVNAFAGQLLIPDWLSTSWLQEVPEAMPVPPFSIRFWAEQCRVSEEVVARALVAKRESVGFLRLYPTRRKRDGAPVLQVLSCASGSAVELPSVRSFIADTVLYELLQANRVGSRWFSSLGLGRCKPQDLGLSWRRAKRWHSQETTWLSILKGTTADSSFYAGALFE
jgi:Zn-dependent peptidase ImmA (M78 family)